MADRIITHVSDTARWVAVYRALETERTDAIFRDPFARRLAGERGAAIAKAMDRRSRADWPMIVRTAVMDEVIMRAVREEGIVQVVNLAAGLDARPWRLDLPRELHWVDVDHAVMLDEKTEALKDERTRCLYEAVRLDLADRDARRDLFERLGAGGPRTLVISEGLLVYLGADDVRGLADDLAATPGFGLWLFDLASPALLKMMTRQWGAMASQGNAPFRFGPEEGTEFFTPSGWREREWHSMVAEAIRLDRAFMFARFWVWVAALFGSARREKFLRFSGMAVLERVR